MKLIDSRSSKHVRNVFLYISVLSLSLSPEIPTQRKRMDRYSLGGLIHLQCSMREALSLLFEIKKTIRGPCSRCSLLFGEDERGGVRVVLNWSRFFHRDRFVWRGQMKDEQKRTTKKKIQIEILKKKRKQKTTYLNLKEKKDANRLQE